MVLLLLHHALTAVFNAVLSEGWKPE